MLNYVRQFIKIRVVFHALYIWNEDGDPHFFYISGTSNSLSDCSKNFKTIYRVENFRANVLKLYEMKVASLFNTGLVPGREKPLQRSLKTSQKCLCYHLPWSLKIFITVFAFLTEKADANEIGGWISIPNFLRKMLT